MFLTVCHFDFHFYYEKVPSSKKEKKKLFGVLDSVRQNVKGYLSIILSNFHEQKIYEEIFGLCVYTVVQLALLSLS